VTGWDPENGPFERSIIRGSHQFTTGEEPLTTLHIEHAITDLGTWLEAFARFEPARRNAGVRSEAIHQPVDDDNVLHRCNQIGC